MVNQDKKKALIYAIIAIVILIIVVMGGTYAYFTARVDVSGEITGSTYDVKLTLDVQKISDTGTKSSNLIPIYDGTNGTSNQLINAAKKDNNCVDSNGYTVCQIYEITVGNSGSESIGADITINFNKGTLTNLKWASMTDGNTVSTTYDITTNTDYTIDSNITLASNSNNTKRYIMVYIRNTGSDQSNTDKDGFSATITVTSTLGEKITATFD